ncbi:MAG: DUF952 domain-containing protein [Flavisolibacter sp.]
MAIIYHVTTKQEWEIAEQEGFYVAPSLKSEGFIHCSEEQQVKGVLERYYKGKKDLLKLVIDTTRLKPELKYELAPSVNEEFPHVFGPINVDAVVSTEVI